jgi:hypothetical protein
MIRVSFYISEQARNESKRELTMRQYSFTPNLLSTEENVLQQAYNYLKTIEEFNGAVNC